MSKIHGAVHNSVPYGLHRGVALWFAFYARSLRARKIRTTMTGPRGDELYLETRSRI